MDCSSRSPVAGSMPASLEARRRLSHRAAPEAVVSVMPPPPPRVGTSAWDAYGANYALPPTAAQPEVACGGLMSNNSSRSSAVGSCVGSDLILDGRQQCVSRESSGGGSAVGASQAASTIVRRFDDAPSPEHDRAMLDQHSAYSEADALGRGGHHNSHRVFAGSASARSSTAAFNGPAASASNEVVDRGGCRATLGPGGPGAAGGCSTRPVTAELPLGGRPRLKGRPPPLDTSNLGGTGRGSLEPIQSATSMGDTGREAALSACAEGEPDSARQRARLSRGGLNSAGRGGCGSADWGPSLRQRAAAVAAADGGGPFSGGRGGGGAAAACGCAGSNGKSRKEKDARPLHPAGSPPTGPAAVPPGSGGGGMPSVPKARPYQSQSQQPQPATSPTSAACVDSGGGGAGGGGVRRGSNGLAVGGATTPGSTDEQTHPLPAEMSLLKEHLRATQAPPYAGAGGAQGGGLCSPLPPLGGSALSPLKPGQQGLHRLGRAATIPEIDPFSSGMAPRHTLAHTAGAYSAGGAPLSARSPVAAELLFLPPGVLSDGSESVPLSAREVQRVHALVAILESWGWRCVLEASESGQEVVALAAFAPQGDLGTPHTPGTPQGSDRGGRCGGLGGFPGQAGSLGGGFPGSGSFGGYTGGGNGGYNGGLGGGFPLFAGGHGSNGGGAGSFRGGCADGSYAGAGGYTGGYSGRYAGGGCGASVQLGPELGESGRPLSGQRGHSWHDSESNFQSQNISGR
ncbi:hypothetical protein T492DRAFT_65387 [Pavlovales sp. CCMP2436]|nr:hypothetical protein T492DRAFT_65387 [Pavlovales sp. CCMP2436]